MTYGGYYLLLRMSQSLGGSPSFCKNEKKFLLDMVFEKWISTWAPESYDGET